MLGPPTQPTAEGMETRRWGRATGTALLAAEEGMGRMLQPDPRGPSALGIWGDNAAPQPPWLSCLQQGGDWVQPMP